MLSALIIWTVHDLKTCVSGGLPEVDVRTRHSDSVGGYYRISSIHQSVIGLVPSQNQERQVTGEGVEVQRLRYIWSD